MTSLAQKIAWALAVVFAITFLIAFIPNPIVGMDALFKTNLGHDLVHLLTAIGFVVVAIMGEKASVIFMKSFGLIYLAVAILGFVMLGNQPEGHLLGIIHINAADNFLHLGLAAGIIGIGFFAGSRASTPQRA